MRTSLAMSRTFDDKDALDSSKASRAPAFQPYADPEAPRPPHIDTAATSPLVTPGLNIRRMQPQQQYPTYYYGDLKDPAYSDWQAQAQQIQQVVPQVPQVQQIVPQQNYEPHHQPIQPLPMDQNSQIQYYNSYEPRMHAYTSAPSTIQSTTTPTAKLASIAKPVQTQTQTQTSSHSSPLISHPRAMLGQDPHSRKSITNTNKYKKFKLKVMQDVNETVKKEIALADLAKYFKITSQSSLKEVENFRNVFSIRCLMEVAYASKVNERGTEVLRSSLYLIYHSISEFLKVEPIGPSSMGKLIRIAFPAIRTKRLGVRGQSKYHYTGIKLKDKYLKFVEKLDDGDSNLKLNRLITENLAFEHRRVDIDTVKFSDLLEIQEDIDSLLSSGTTNSSVVDPLTMDDKTSAVFASFVRLTVVDSNVQAGVAQLFSGPLQDQYAMELLVYYNFAACFQEFVSSGPTDRFLAAMRKVARDYVAEYMTHLRVIEHGGIMYRKRLAMAKLFARSVSRLAELSCFSDCVADVLQASSQQMLRDLGDFDFQEHAQTIFSHNIHTHPADGSDMQKANLLLSKLSDIIQSNRYHRIVDIHLRTSVHLDMLLPELPQLLHGPQAGVVRCFSDYLQDVMATFENYSIHDVGITVVKLYDDMMRSLLMRAAEPDAVRNWLILKNWVSDWWEFSNFWVLTCYLMYESSLDTARNPVIA